jgi:hypothetical protein
VGETRGEYRVLEGKTETRRPLVRPRRRWVDNIKMYLKEVGWGYGLDRCSSGQGQVAGSCEYGDEHSVSIK